MASNRTSGASPTNRAKRAGIAFDVEGVLVANDRATIRPDRRCASRYHPAMSKLLLNLRNVPDDEADDVRAFLDANRIAYYETRPSLWGISAGGIWVAEDAEIAEAKRLMAAYQAERGARARAEYAAARAAGTAETFWMVLRADPVRVVLTVLAILCLLGLVALPVILLRG